MRVFYKADEQLADGLGDFQVLPAGEIMSFSLSLTRSPLSLSYPLNILQTIRNISRLEK